MSPIHPQLTINTALFDAIKACNIIAVKTALESGANPNAENDSQPSPRF
jgi:hypothetical protein